MLNGILLNVFLPLKYQLTDNVASGHIQFINLTKSKSEHAWPFYVQRHIYIKSGKGENTHTHKRGTCILRRFIRLLKISHET